MYMFMMFLPLMSFLMCSVFGSSMGQNGAKFLSCFLMLNSFYLSMIMFIDVMAKENLNNIFIMDWFTMGLLSCKFSLNFDYMVCSMLMLVLGVSLLVHLFSTSYMDGDPHLPSFMSYLSLFTFFMVILVTSGNLVQLFMGWEGVGLCSYLLINFWFTSIQANKASMKAMMMNKMGDLSLMLAMSIMMFYFGSWDYSVIFSNMLNYDNQKLLDLCSVLLLIGVIGKSAQMGLHTWLPDAMEGPTPVSALIHAATMVTAGVFLMMSLSPLFELCPFTLFFIILVGSLTAFFSSTIGLTQNDLKKVMAYSTCSQLGYMVLMCGFSYYNLGLYHLINHGFFKALLFLSAGSIIHAVTDEQDMSKMGSMMMMTPFTYVCIMIGSLSLMGLPFLTGFYSKDLIMEMIYGNHMFSFGLILAMMSASLTAFYSFSLIHYSFFLNPQNISSSMSKSHEGEWNLTLPLFFLLMMSVLSGYMMQNYVLFDEIPVILPNLMKFSALMVTLIGTILALMLGVYINKSWVMISTKLFQMVYSFSNIAWYFDKVMAFYLINPILKIGFNISYKFIDNQVLEYLGPSWMSKFVVNKGSMLSNAHSGYLYSYMFLFLMFVGCFLIQL